MRKYVSVLLAIMAVFLLFGCQGNLKNTNSSVENSANDNKVSNEKPTYSVVRVNATADSVEPPSNGNKVTGEKPTSSVVRVNATADSVEPPSNGDKVSSERYTSSVAWANYTDNAAIFTKSLNSNKMQISSVRHLPLFKCESLTDLNDFKAQFKDILDFSHGYDEVLSFDEITAKYTEDYFYENILLIIYVSAGSGSFRFAVDGVNTDARSTVVSVKQTNNPEVYTQDMAGWLLTVEMKKSAVQSCTEFDAYLNS